MQAHKKRAQRNEYGASRASQLQEERAECTTKELFWLFNCLHIKLSYNKILKELRFF